MTSSRNFDAGALAAAMSRPGMDPRVWLINAVVMDLGHDPQEGHFAEVKPQPTGPAFTCYVGQPYAGNDFGMHFPLKRGDTVLVAVPMGDTGLGPWIVSRRWDASDRPPVEAGQGDEPVTAVVLKVERGQDLRIIVSGGGNIQIEARDNSNVDVTVGGNVTAEVQGNAEVIVHGNMECTVDGNVTCDVGGNMDVTCSGNINADATAINLTGQIPVALSNYVDQNINALATRLDTHQHMYATPAGTPAPTTPMVPPVPPIAPTMTPTAAQKVNAS